MHLQYNRNDNIVFIFVPTFERRKIRGFPYENTFGNIHTVGGFHGKILHFQISKGIPYAFHPIKGSNERKIKAVVPK